MSTDVQVIRAERHEEVGALIKRDAVILLENWCRRAIEEQPHAKRVHHDVLRDRLASLLRAMGNSLSASEDGEASPHCIPAAEHGEQRWETGWSLPEVVRDYQILRLVIVDHLTHTLHRPLRHREVMAIGLALDEAITASVQVYVSSRDEYVGQVESERLEALQAADRRKDEFLAILGHELRNPLASVLNSVAVLRLSAPNDAQIAQAGGIVERQIQQMVRLIDDLLDVTRISQGKLELRKQRFDVAVAVEQALQTVRPLIEARQHQLTVQLPSESLWVEADEARLVQVLVNLLNNAAKYTDPGGKIVLTGEHYDSLAVIRVRDNGIGIDPEMLGHVFELYTQLDPGRDRSRGGLGIGLTLVRRLVELQGGQVAAFSPGKGQGSEFVVKLPACSSESEPVKSAAKAAPQQATVRILIIEDDDDARATLQLLLQFAGHRVETAPGGAQGLAMARAGAPQVILVDIGLPEMDGYEVARALRKEFGKNIFLLALTGFGQSEDQRQALEAGFDAHLTKPVDLEALSRLLAAVPPSRS
jgi:signal transduction histidine kinase/ActR/RegA family two-component response regulator